MADDEFESAASSGASETYPKQCSALRKNDHVCIKGKPCKIVEMSTSKTGKHGHAKVHLVGIDVFSGKKLEDICPSTHNMNVPFVTRIELTAVGVSDDGFMMLMDDAGNTREDLPKPKDEDLLKRLEAFLEQQENGDIEVFLVTVMKAMGEEQIIDVKAAKAS